MSEVSEHYAMDVPRLTRIVEPLEHAGKMIMSVEYQGITGRLLETPRQVKFVIDTGEVIWFPPHRKVKVETGPERAGKLAWARGVIDGKHPPVADERQVREIAETFALEYDSVSVETPDEVGRVRVCGYLEDVLIAVTVVSPDGTVSPKLTPVKRVS